MTDGEKGHIRDTKVAKTVGHDASLDNFVLEKGIFSNIFDKDIRRVYIYKKAERLAKAIHLVAPAFHASAALRNRIDAVAVDLVDAATLPPLAAREAMSRELLALSSVLSVARVGGLLSAMNADLIAREAHQLLTEIASYEEPRLFLDDAPTLANLAKASTNVMSAPPAREGNSHAAPKAAVKDTKGHISDSRPSKPASTRRDAVLEVLKTKGPSYIKDISTVIREVSEKTIQRELAQLVAEGLVSREGERRWTRYTSLEA